MNQGQSRMPRSVGVDVMLCHRSFERVAEYPLFKFSVCHGEAVMLSFMFGPGIHQKLF